MRQGLDIYASVVLIKNIPGYKTRHSNVDLCIIRENTEGEYSGLEHQSVPGVVESLKIITRAKSHVSRPQQFDVMVVPNLYGGILSNVGAALVGGPGVVPGCNMGRGVAVFEPGCRHVGLDIKGKDQANPTAILLSGSMLLRHLGLDDHANRLSKGIYDVIKEG
ncbi:MAG: isocitrate dehydrogenase (NAD(+)) idh1 [Geoglossum umbratile]|nr:MAG: isocitrate dehydrogenase (NAD(+)) idh1 [Geoglossum umbratile]